MQIDTTSAIFLKRKWYEDLKNNVPMSLTRKYKIQIHKYTNTNTQIHKYKYTNTVWVKFAERSTGVKTTRFFRAFHNSDFNPKRWSIIVYHY